MYLVPNLQRPDQLASQVMLQRKYTARQYELHNHNKIKATIPCQCTVVKNNSLFIFAIICLLLFVIFWHIYVIRNLQLEDI